ncbi:MAG: hypothetical protein JETCAE03_32270 [Ignavibacteriaceae bacterium]|jgi:dTDP-4-amino-4,6-dideoxygalactose transaminase|nr:MAG: hypothetical protein JETCAE03_32270 [Ignavibacteriaceae bacterium]
MNENTRLFITKEKAISMLKKQDFTVVTEFENKVAEFFGAKYGVAVDSCTHGIELCLRYFDVKEIFIPKRTYISVPMLAHKLNIKLHWEDYRWQDLYRITADADVDYAIYDAATLWGKNYYNLCNKLDGYNCFLNISFQYQKHLNLGRGGMILTNDKEAAIQLKKMSYDGRLPNIPWRYQDIDTIGYHYYMTPETAKLGLDKLQEAIETKPRQWTIEDWPDISKMKVFKNKSHVAT